MGSSRGRLGLTLLTAWSILPLLTTLPYPPYPPYPAYPASQSQPQEPSFRSTTSELVVLPVVVADKHGQTVADLSRDQFTVFDNGRRVPIEFFSAEDTPVTVGLVIDASSSMRRKLGAVIAASVRFAALSNPDDELFTVRFNDNVQDLVRDHHFLFASDRVALESALGSMVPEGQTALYDALIDALDHLDEGTRARKVLIVMSDGGDNASTATLDAVLARARRSNAVIYTIGLFDQNDPDANPRVLKALANATGGERFMPRSIGLLLSICEHIAHEVRSGYTIGYEPPDHDGFYHHVRVVVDAPDRKLNVRTRPGYFAGKETTRQ